MGLIVLYLLVGLALVLGFYFHPSKGYRNRAELVVEFHRQTDLTELYTVLSGRSVGLLILTVFALMTMAIWPWGLVTTVRHVLKRKCKKSN